MSPSSEAETVVHLPPTVALHARPAADFVRTAMRFGARVEVAANGRQADAKRLLSVLGLGATAGNELRLKADGDDAGAAVDALMACVAAFEE